MHQNISLCSVQLFCILHLQFAHQTATRWARLDTIYYIKKENTSKKKKKILKIGVFCLSGGMVMEHKNAHIQPLRFGELLLLPSMEQFEYRGRNRKGKHMSLSFSMLHWWLVHASASTVFCLFALVASLFCASPGCLPLWACIYGFCNFAAFI